MKNIKISDELHKFLKIKAVEKDMNLYQLIEFYINKEKEKEEKREGKKE